ncbi:MAG: hypothetical protein M3Q46_11830 [Verrucomicrobiota bacterium]|nr:hypothetical protein [Verrucomicrobiota bacterium]
MNFPKFPLVVLAMLSLVASLSARLWTTVTGEKFEAEFVRTEGGTGIFRVKGKEYPYPLNRLSVADRLLIGRTINQQTGVTASPAPSEEPAPTTPEDSSANQSPIASADKTAPPFAGEALKPGGSVEIEIPILDPAGLRETQHAYGKPSSKARMLLALPNEFDPSAKEYPLLIVSATADGGASSIATAFQYLDEALAQGFVVIAVDGEFGKPTAGDPPSFRWALVAAARDAMEKEWPGAKKWPVATGGVSGGGGYASYNALKLLQERANFIGLLLAVSPHNPTKFMSKVNSAPVTVAHRMPIFMSAGEKDQTATREITDASHEALLHDGFKNVRYEHFDGGHQLYKPHLHAALAWFLEESSKPH